MIPYLDLRAQYRAISDELNQAVLSVLEGGDYVLGESVARFEKDFAAYCGTSQAVALNSGTSALHLALLAIGVGPGDEVITVPATFVATVAAIRYTGAQTVLVDIDPETWTMDPDALERAITPRTKAIMPVHLHGRLSDMGRIMAIAHRHGLVVIEDAAQAHGADFRGRRAGSFGAIGCFSFYPGKNLGACGEGGAIVTDREDLADTIRSLRDWGQAGKYNHVRHGYNFRMDGIQGAALGVKLKHLPTWTMARRKIAALYDRGLAPLDMTLPRPPVDLEHVYHVYAVRVRERERVQAELKAAGIATGIHYPRPVHLQPAYADLGHWAGDFPVSEALARETMSLPIYPELTEPEIARIVIALHRICGGRNVDAA